MNEYLQIIINAVATGVGMGAGIAIGTYFANKTFIQNLDRIEKALRAKQNSEKEQEE
jgi:predicted choloylglycine hydrolase